MMWRAIHARPYIVVATDVAGRGLDITGLEHVVNWVGPG